MSEAPALTSFPRTQESSREGQGGAAWREGNRDPEEEGGLEQKALGPESGGSGIAPTSRTLSNLLLKDQNFQVYFYSRGKRAARGWSSGWVVEHSLSTHQALGSICNTI